MGKTRQYRPVRGSRLSQRQAETYGAYLHQLKAENGGLKPQDVVEDAKSPASPLHEWFEWDVDQAAEKYWLTQAQYLMRSINIVVKVREQPVETRLFHSIVVVEERVYASIDSILTEEDKKAQVVQQALDQLRSWTEKYRIYEELYGVVSAIEGFL